MQAEGTPRTLPSLDLGEYALHDRDGFLEFVSGMWFHTLGLVGHPNWSEAYETLKEVPVERRQRIIDVFYRRGLVVLNMPPPGRMIDPGKPA